MSRLTAVALIVVGLAIPACAQRAASRGGFSGHAAPASRGGFSAPAPNRFAGSPRDTGSRPLVMVRGSQRGGPGNSIARHAYTGDSRNRRPYRSPYERRFPYALPGIGPYFIGYPNDIGYDDSSAAPDYGPEGYGPQGYDTQGDEQGQQEPPIPHRPEYDQPHQPPVLGSEEAVTIVFKDGRPPEQIHNYVLTRTTLYVGDQHHRDIPIDQLDLAATVKVNHDAGVDFRLPDSPK